MKTLLLSLLLAGTLLGDELNLATGEYFADMSGGDLLNLSTGEYFVDMSGGDKLNLSTGEYFVNMDEPDFSFDLDCFED